MFDFFELYYNSLASIMEKNEDSSLPGQFLLLASQKKETLGDMAGASRSCPSKADDITEEDCLF